MKRIARFLCVLLAFSMAWTPVSVQAAMIGTGQALAAAEVASHRDKLAGFVQRADVASQLERLGVSSAAAQERVNALTSDEISRLAGNIDTLPAGAAAELSIVGSTWLIAAIIALIVFLVWYRPART